jgi:hypothetical protein
LLRQPMTTPFSRPMSYNRERTTQHRAGRDADPVAAIPAKIRRRRYDLSSSGARRICPGECPLFAKHRACPARAGTTGIRPTPCCAPAADENTSARPQQVRTGQPA